LVKDVSEGPEHCVVDFVHPKIRVEEPIAYYVSSVDFNKKAKSLHTTVRSKVDGFKELYLDYCCEKENNECVQVCRPHFQADKKIVSVEAVFLENSLKKFDRLLEEIR